MSILRQVFRALVSGFNNMPLATGELLQSTTSIATANPSLKWSVAGWKSDMWQEPWSYHIQWDVPTTLRVQSESGNPDALLGALDDIDGWASQIYGLPIDPDGDVVPYGDRYIKLSKEGKLFQIADRFTGPYIQRVTVRPNEADNSYATADLLMHVDFIVDKTPQTKSKALVFNVGANILYPNHANNITPVGDKYTLPLASADDTRSQGAFASPYPTTLTLGGDSGVEVKAAFPPVLGNIPTVDGTKADPVREITVTPASATVAALATQQLSAIAFHVSGVGDRPPFTWATTNAAVATVDASGLVTGVAAGTCSITASYDGVSGSSAITVS